MEPGTSMLPISDATLAELLERRLKGGRAFQFFARRLGPNDVVYAAVQAWGVDDNHIECRASAMTFRDALIQLFQNLDQATAPEPTS